MCYAPLHIAVGVLQLVFGGDRLPLGRNMVLRLPLRRSNKKNVQWLANVGQRWRHMEALKKADPLS